MRLPEMSAATLRSAIQAARTKNEKELRSLQGSLARIDRESRSIVIRQKVVGRLLQIQLESIENLDIIMTAVEGDRILVEPARALDIIKIADSIGVHVTIHDAEWRLKLVSEKSLPNGGVYDGSRWKLDKLGVPLVYTSAGAVWNPNDPKNVIFYGTTNISNIDAAIFERGSVEYREEQNGRFRAHVIGRFPAKILSCDPDAQAMPQSGAQGCASNVPPT